MVRFLFLSTVIAFLALSFNNCGRVLPGQGLESAVFSSQASFGKALCDSQLQSVFSSTYHGYLSGRCQTCHSTSHGSANVSTSFSAFQAKDFALYKYQARTSHGGAYTPAADAGPVFDSMEATWNSAVSRHTQCLAEVGETGGSVADVLLVAKPLPANIETQSRANLNNYVTMTWQTDVDVDQNSDLNKFKATFTIQMRISYSNGTGGLANGMAIRNPTFTLKSGQSGPVIMDQIALRFDSTDIAQFTGFNENLLPIAATGSTNIAPGISPFAPVPNPTAGVSQIAFRLKRLRLSSGAAINDPAPGGGGAGAAAPTFRELMGTDPARNVFARTCAGCHSPTGPNGNVLDITNYGQAAADATIILNRINNGSMPPGRPLSPADAALVQQWSDAGRPQ